MDFRFGIPLAEMRICNVAPLLDVLGIENSRLLAPGAPESSVLLARMARRGEGQMPPLATKRTDDQGLALVQRWIRELTQCEVRAAERLPIGSFPIQMTTSHGVPRGHGNQRLP
jgi:hypothetical protein